MGRTKGVMVASVYTARQALIDSAIAGHAL